jgi:hypothetical protein
MSDKPDVLFVAAASYGSVNSMVSRATDMAADELPREITGAEAAAPTAA